MFILKPRLALLYVCIIVVSILISQRFTLSSNTAVAADAVRALTSTLVESNK